MRLLLVALSVHTTIAIQMEDDVDEARLQLRQALAHCAEDREELDRLRKMLQQERESAQRREREIEEMQTSNAEEVAKLSDTLRKAEQVISRLFSLPHLARGHSTRSLVLSGRVLASAFHREVLLSSPRSIVHSFWRSVEG